MVGDTSTDYYAEGYFSFDIGQIPSGATILSATLRLYHEATLGTPFEDLGPLLVDHLDYGDTLDPGDANLAALQADVGSLAQGSIGQYVGIDAGGSVQDDVSLGRPRSQYRLRFTTTTDNDGVEDSVFFTGYGGTQNKPQLVVRYE